MCEREHAYGECVHLYIQLMQYCALNVTGYKCTNRPLRVVYGRKESDS